MNSSSLSPAAAADTAGLSHREFAVSGMTCAACAARVERVLGRQPGVAEASVNLATRRASVRFDPLRLGTAELTATVERAGYGFAPADPGRPPARVADELDEAEVAARRRWLVRLVVAVPLTVTVVVLTRVTDTARSGWWAVGLAVPVVFGAGFPFLRGAWRQVRSGHANMDVLIALGSLAAFGYSVREVLVPPAVHRAHDGWAHAHLDMAPLIVTFLLLGRWLEARAEHRAGRALRALADLGPSTARVLDGDDTSPRVVSVESVHPGDRFLVLPGDRVPVDGVVVSGLSAVDESMLTGEPLPIDKAPGTTVAAASHNVTGSFVARATAVGADTTFARIVALVERAQGSKAPVQRLADRVAAVFVPAVVAVAVLTVLGWTVTGQPGRGVLAGIAVLVVACPCSLGLATPVAIMVGTGRGAALGILINGGESLEQCHRLDTVVFDKTGTLTRGTPTVTGQWTAADAGTAVDVLGLVAAAEAGSEHPVGAALVAHGLASGATGRRATAFRSFAGHGVRAEVDGHDVVVGRAGFVSPVAPFRSTPDLTALVARAEEEGSTLVLAAVDGRLSAAFALADTVKPEARAAVAELRGLGLDVAVVSGDGSRPAHHVAHAVGITDVEADATPSDKLAAIERRRVGGARVAMVGDGVNDAAALAAADVGIAMGSGTAVAQHTAGVVLLSGGLDGVGRAIRLARATYTTILQNLGWAFGYNLAALPLAAVGRLTPAVAGLAMGLSSVCVVTNSLRLNRFERAGRPASIAGAGRRRAGVALAWAAPVVVLLALGLGRSLLPAQYADVSRRRPAGAGLEVSVDILDARAGSNTIHVYLLGDGGLVGLADLRVSGRLVQFSHLPPVTAAVSLDPAGRGHRRGVITMPAGYWLFEIDGTAEDGRTVRAAFNAEIPD